MFFYGLLILFWFFTNAIDKCRKDLAIDSINKATYNLYTVFGLR